MFGLPLPLMAQRPHPRAPAPLPASAAAPVPEPMPVGSFGPGRGPMPAPAPPVDLGDVDAWNAPVQGSFGPGRGPMPPPVPPGIEAFRPPMAPPGIEAFRPPMLAAQGAVGPGRGPMISDERSKAKIQPMEDPTLATRAYWQPVVDATTAEAQPAYYKTPIRPGVDLRAAKGYEYEYKDPTMPGAEPGRHVGPMAQDLEKTAAANVVKTGPDGMKKVDTNRLSLVNTAALAEQQKRMDRLEAIARMQAPAPLPPVQQPMPAQQFQAPDLSALDAAYAQQQADTGVRY